MPVLTVRISEKEKTVLVRRSKQEGITTAALVRRMIHEIQNETPHETPFITAADVLADIERRVGDTRLRVRRRK